MTNDKYRIMCTVLYYCTAGNKCYGMYDISTCHTPMHIHTYGGAALLGRSSHEAVHPGGQDPDPAIQTPENQARSQSDPTGHAGPLPPPPSAQAQGYAEAETLLPPRPRGMLRASPPPSPSGYAEAETLLPPAQAQGYDRPLPPPRGDALHRQQGGMVCGWSPLVTVAP